MLINLRNALMGGKRLPYDAEVEYLQSSGTQYIDTGEKIYDDTSVTVTMYSDYSTEAATYFFGSDSSTERFYFREYQGKASFSTGGWWQNTNIGFVGTHTVTMTNNSITVDGVQSSRTGTSKTGAGKLQFFKSGTYGMTKSGVRIYSCKIWQNSVLVRDFIPVRVGTVGYLYDRVSGKLFGNAGTGDFVLGPDVVPVEYIESHGAERILTDIYTDANTAINCKASGTSGSFFGVLPSSNTAWWTILPNDSGKLRYYYGGSGATDVATIDATVPHDYQCSNKVLVDGVEAISLSRTLGSANVPLSLFARTASSGTSYTSLLVGRMWYLQIIQSGAIVRSFRPIRVGTEGAMMDVLTRRIYRNAGTGAFGYGNDLKYPIPAA